IPPHITEVQSPQRINNITFTGTWAKPNEISDLNTGIFTKILSAQNIAPNTNAIPTVDTTVNIARLDTFAPIEAPHKRPIIIKNQYVPTTDPAIVGSMFISGEVINKLAKLGMP